MNEIILSMVIWGTLGVFVLWSKMAALDIAFYRCIIGMLGISLYIVKTRPHIKLDKPFLITISAGILVVLNWWLLFKSFQLSSITIGNMAYYLQPVILILVGFMFKFEAFKWRKLLLIIVSFLGVILTIKPSSLLGQGNIFSGVMYAVCAATIYSVVTILMRNISRDIFVIIWLQLLVGSLMLIPFAKLTLPTSPTSISCLLIIGIVHTIFAYVLYYRGIKKIAVSKIAILSYLDPICAIFTDILFFKQQLNTTQIIGILITFGAGFILIKQKA